MVVKKTKMMDWKFMVNVDAPYQVEKWNFIFFKKLKVEDQLVKLLVMD